MADSNDIDKNSQIINDANVEIYVMGIIRKIKKSRSRPCFQNLLTLLNRGGNNTTMEHLKAIINNLTEKNMICDNGRGK